MNLVQEVVCHNLWHRSELTGNGFCHQLEDRNTAYLLLTCCTSQLTTLQIMFMFLEDSFIVLFYINDCIIWRINYSSASFIAFFLCIFSFSSRCPFHIWFGWHSVGGLSLLYNVKNYLDTIIIRCYFEVIPVYIFPLVLIVLCIKFKYIFRFVILQRMH